MATNMSDQRNLSARLEIIQEIEGMRHELMRQKVGSRLNLLEARNARLDLEEQVEHLQQPHT